MAESKRLTDPNRYHYGPTNTERWYAEHGNPLFDPANWKKVNTPFNSDICGVSAMVRGAICQDITSFADWPNVVRALLTICCLEKVHCWRRISMKRSSKEITWQSQTDDDQSIDIPFGYANSAVTKNVMQASAPQPTHQIAGRSHLAASTAARSRHAGNLPSISHFEHYRHIWHQSDGSRAGSIEGK